MTANSTLLLGGARSGKSDMAVRMAVAWSGPVSMVATAEAFDADMAARIAQHRLERPAHWTVIEEPIDLATAAYSADETHFLLIDCLTTWVGTLMHREYRETDIQARVETLMTVLGRRRTPTVLVSNEVGLGLHPETELGRQYRDILGRVNQRVANSVDRAFLVVAGRALPLLDAAEVM